MPKDEWTIPGTITDPESAQNYVLEDAIMAFQSAVVGFTTKAAQRSADGEAIKTLYDKTYAIVLQAYGYLLAGDTDGAKHELEKILQ